MAVGQDLSPISFSMHTSPQEFSAITVTIVKRCE